jgi:hypothetical protein
MLCGSDEAERRDYRVYEGREGRVWFVADQDDPAGNIYVYEPSDAGKPSSMRGFAGRTLMFITTEGEEISVKAPWHSNADALFRDTGVDVRGKHRTFTVIANERDWTPEGTTLRGVIHRDELPVIGLFDRGHWIAQGIANILDRHVFVYEESRGGSSCGAVFPIDDGPDAYLDVEDPERDPLITHSHYVREMDKEGRWQGNRKHPKYPWKK